MSLITARLSTQVEAGFSATSRYQTDITQLHSGQECRNVVWPYPRRTYTTRYAKWERTAREELLASIYVTQGQAHSFLFRDWNDYRVEAQSLGNAPAGTTPVQLVRTYTFGSTTRSRPIRKPVASTVVVRQLGVLKSGTVDAATGLFTPATAWTEGAALTADFEFDVEVRFASDEIEVVLPHRDICEVNCDLVEVFA